MELCKLSVGDEGCDIEGFTNVHIQCAVDRLAMLGGGIVELSAGVFQMADALHLRSHVTVRGSGSSTVLRKAAMKKARVSTFLGYGHYDVVVDEPDAFSLGDGILLSDDTSGGFLQTVGTLIRREGDTWFTSVPHAHDYRARDNGLVRTLYPLVSAVDVREAILEDLIIDGKAAQNERLNGCRGGGFFAHRSDDITVRGVTVRDFCGDGFSFQTCDDLELRDCVAQDCEGHGFHPGSGSNRFHIHHCRASRCGECGLFYCLRVRDSLLEKCTFEENGSHGVSIGSRDVDHLNRCLTVCRNGGAGIYLRPGGRATAAHGNRIEGCALEDNCRGDGEGEIVLQGEAEDVQVVGNTIRRRAETPGLLIKAEMPPFVWEDNVVEPGGEGAVVDRR